MSVESVLYRGYDVESVANAQGNHFTCSYEVRLQASDESVPSAFRQFCQGTFGTAGAGHHKARELARLLIDLLIDGSRK